MIPFLRNKNLKDIIERNTIQNKKKGLQNNTMTKYGKIQPWNKK